MKLRVAFFCFLFILNAQSQSCDCLSQFSYIVDYFEQNNPAFQLLKTNKKHLKKYASEVRKITREIKQKNPSETCPMYFEKYVTLLNDHHSGIGYNLTQLDFSSDSLIQHFKKSDEYRKFTKIDIDTSDLLKKLAQKSVTEIEGLYSNGGDFVFGIIKKEKSNNEFLGVALNQTAFLDIGHVILELKLIDKNLYDCTFNVGLFGFNFQKIYKRIKVVNGQMVDFGFFKSVDEVDRFYEFKSLDERTNYLRLSSFDGSLINELDSFYTAIDEQLRSKPLLIIDLRNNTGGNEQAYFDLMPYIYTNPLKVDSVLVWVTPDNIKLYDENAKEPKLIDRMKRAKPYTFIPMVEKQSNSSGKATNLWKMDSITLFPKRIAVIYNNATASSAEGLITYCLQSTKVITVGENSGGYIGYGDVMTAPTPCGQYILFCTTTKYHANSKYEFVGIEPMFKPDAMSNWIDYARKILNETDGDEPK